jgi:hypothetical protein
MIVQPSHTSYRWTTFKIILSYDVTQRASNFGAPYILREDNISNVVRLLNEKKDFARMKSVTDHDVWAFLEEEREKYHWICELAKLPYVYCFTQRLRTLFNES